MERKLWIDWMKAIGMFFIILGHLFPTGFVSFIYSFSVPLFFMISGYLTNIKQDKSIYMSKCVRGLLIPYALIWLVNVVIYALMAKSVPSDMLEKSIGFLFGLEMYIGALWFVYTLFICKIIVFAVRKLSGSNRSYFLWLIFCSITSVVGMYLLNRCNQTLLIEPISSRWPSLSIMFKGRIAWAWTNVLCSMPFFTFGLILRGTNTLNPIVNKLSNIRSWFLLVISAFMLVILYPLAEMNGNMFMYDCGYGNNIFLCYVNALIGSFSILCISIYLQKYSLCGVVGLFAMGSIIVLGFHGIPLNITMLKCPYITTIGGDFIGNLMFALVLYLAFVPIIKLVKKYLPIMLGGR